MPLITTPNFDSGDDFYEALLAAHQDLDVAGSQAFNARLILLLANHIGRQDVLLEALSAAARSLPAGGPDTDSKSNSRSNSRSNSSSVSIEAPTPGTASPRGQA